MRPTRLMFGINVATTATATNHPVAAAMRAESLGYDFSSANDHPCGTRPSYETWTMLTWIAAKTSRLKIASRVLGVPYRAPAMVAKMAETLDRLSGGRLILGLGAGGADEEFRAFGLRVASPNEKIEGLEEAVTIIRGLWTSRAFSFTGKHHHTDAADIEPKPEHDIPIWLGTFGKHSLDVTGRVGDGWIPTLEMAPPETIPVMRDRIFDAAVAAGRHPEQLTLAYNMEFRVGNEVDLPAHVVTGRPQELREKLVGFAVDLGFSAMNFIPAGPDPERQVELLAQDILPAVRSEASELQSSV